jgi:hypothetical protein
MSEKDTTEKIHSSQAPEEAKVYEVREFANIDPDAGYVQLRHYRTIYHPDGHISQEEVASAEASLQKPQQPRSFADGRRE